MNPYDVLGIEKTATPGEVKAAFRREASKAHPDREGGSSERMAAVNEAHAVLSDPDRRKRYDESGQTDQPRSVDEEATQMLAQLFGQALQQEAPELVAFARAAAARLQADLHTKSAQMRGQVEKLTKRRSKVRTKDGARNLVHSLIDAQLEGLGNAIEQADRGLQVVEAAQKLLADYDEDTPPPPAQTGYSFLGGLSAAAQQARAW